MRSTGSSRSARSKQFWKEAGFIAYRVQRQKIKIDNQVTCINTEAIHLNVMPTNGTLAKTAWPVLRIEGPDRGRDGPRVFFPEYKICQHPELPGDDKFCRNRCHALKPCDCDRVKAKQEERERVAREAGLPPPKKQKPGKASTLALVSRALKSDKPCAHFLKGMCRCVVAGMKCGFIHDPEVAAGTIQCAKEFPEGGCPNGPKCLYLHSIEKMDAASAAGPSGAAK